MIITIIGLGIIGGSYAEGLTKAGHTVYGVDKNLETIEYAKKEGYIIDGATDAKIFISKADLVVIGLYPNDVIPFIENNLLSFKPGQVVTDVCGVKECICSKATSLLKDSYFIGSHPMAGRETSGITNSDERIFYGMNYLVVPTERNTDEGIEACKRIGEILGFGKISEISPENHDKMIGFVSQLTHCIAVALMNCYEHASLERYTADSFRDLTRIAKINEKMWSELFLANKDALLGEMELFQKQLSKMHDYLKADDRQGLMDMMIVSTERRKLFDK